MSKKNFKKFQFEACIELIRNYTVYMVKQLNAYSSSRLFVGDLVETLLEKEGLKLRFS